MENLSLLFLIFITVYDDHIFLSFDKDLPGQSSCHLYMPFQLLQNQASGHIKVKKGSCHVFYMATPSHTNESVGKEAKKDKTTKLSNSKLFKIKN